MSVIHLGSDVAKRFESVRHIMDDSFLDYCDGMIRQLYKLWRERHRGALLPGKSDLPPEDMFSLLPYIFIVDRDPFSEDYRYKLIGRNEALARNSDPTGKLVKDACAGKAEEALHNYDYIFKQGRPLFTLSDIVETDDFDIKDQTLFLPLSGDGVTVNMAMAISVQLRTYKENGRPKGRPQREKWERGRLPGPV